MSKIHGYFVVGFAHRLGGSRWKLAENLIPFTWVVDDDDDDDDDGDFDDDDDDVVVVVVVKLYTKISEPFCIYQVAMMLWLPSATRTMMNI